MSISTYFKETKAELSHVVWPTQRQVVIFTMSVVVISIVTAYVLGGFDTLLTKGLHYILNTK